MQRTLMISFWRKRPVLLFLFFQHLMVCSHGQSIIPFDTVHWNMEQARVSEHLGREAATGMLTLREGAFGNGIIEVDIAVEQGIKSYPGVVFRDQGNGQYERVYIRPHRSGFYEDALQYAPSFHGADSWQLYGGTGNAAGLDISPGTWNHLKIVVSGDRANIFWNDDSIPALVIGCLAHGTSSGGIALRSTVPGKVFFSHFTLVKSESVALAPVVKQEPVCGKIDSWEISAPYPLTKVDFNTYPAREFLTGLTWQTVDSDEKGVVDLSKYHARVSQVGDCILAKASLHAEKDTVLRLGLGYSDYITVYLNEVPVFSGNSAYQSRDGSFLGMIGYHDILFLPLKRGENILTLQVGETMGGWAFCCRKEDQVCMDPSVKRRFTLKEGVSYPEAIVYDEKAGVCYVANYFKEGRESISMISTDGKLLKEAWIEGLKRPTGMCIKDRILYAVDRTGLNVIDADKGVVIRKIDLTGITMPNDVTIDRNGVLYISDTRGNTVFRLPSEKPEPWLGPEGIESPNALLADGDSILVGQNQKLLIVSITDKKMRTLAEFAPGANIDGIQKDGHGGYLVSDYNGQLYRVSPAGGRELLINTTTQGDQIADFVFIPSLKRLIIPTLMGNSVKGYQY